jgi:hypothetical protein
MSESWLRKATKKSKISIPNYNISVLETGRQIYCRESLQSSVILSRSMPKQFELLLLKIHLSRNKSHIVERLFIDPLSSHSP